ncbi:CagZ [Snodgrassella alvi SCGC AB-598-P14]|nr:CagZ [Snodgrassella alvi SCGC AB-598-P14]
MVKAKLKILYSCCLLFSTLICGASDIPRHTFKPNYPEAPNRTFIQNYKDMVFAHCITKAYKDSDEVGKDAGSSVGALRQWIDYDMNESIDEEIRLVSSYLSRDYFNPLAESEVKGLKFDFLKCLDLYHSKELDKLARKVVPYPQRKASQGY